MKMSLRPPALEEAIALTGGRIILWARGRTSGRPNTVAPVDGPDFMIAFRGGSHLMFG